MKTLILGLTLLSLNTFANSEDCYLYDAGYDQTYMVECSSLNIDQAEDEGYAVFNELSTNLLDGCLISEYSEQELSREYSSSVCEQGIDEGWVVLGRL